MALPFGPVDSGSSNPPALNLVTSKLGHAPPVLGRGVSLSAQITRIRSVPTTVPSINWQAR